MSSPPARSTSTRPSAGAWPVREISHARDHRDRTVHPRPDPQNSGRLEVAETLEVLDQTVRQLGRGEANALEVIDTLFAEELTLRENRRIKMALRMAKLSTIKTLAGFDFSFQPSLDRNRILALSQLDFVDCHEVIHFLDPPGTGKSHLATALGVEAMKVGRSVRCSIGCFTTLSSSRSKNQAAGCDSMLISCPSTSAPKPPSTRRSRHSRRAAAVAHSNMEPMIASQPADYLDTALGNFASGTSGEI
jgi:hypothetical protein